jgi:hypothetical protein
MFNITDTNPENVAAQVRENDRARAEITAKREAADRAAYLATPQGKAELAAEQAEAEREAYAMAIMSLPEAEDRPYTARRLAMAHNAQSMPIAKAAMFLRGLPAEPAEQPSTLTKKADQMAEKTLMRKVEIRLAALSFNADRGNDAARKEANAIRYAMRLNAHGTDLQTALRQSGANLAAFN